MGSRKYRRVGRQHQSHQNSLFIAVAVANRGQGFCRIVPLGQWYAIQVHISRKLCSTKRGNYFCTMIGGWIQMLLIIFSVTSLFADLLSLQTEILSISISDCILFCHPVKLSTTSFLVFLTWIPTISWNTEWAEINQLGWKWILFPGFCCTFAFVLFISMVYGYKRNFTWVPNLPIQDLAWSFIFCCSLSRHQSRS